MAGLRDNKEDLYDVNGNYVGQGGQGMVTQPGVDPSDGGHAQVVKAGVEKLETDVAAGQNGVVQVKGALPGWNRGGRSRAGSPMGGVVSTARQVVDIAQANGNTAPAADAVKSPAPKAQVTQPDVAGGGTILGGVSTPAMRVAATRYALKGGDAEREFGDKLQEGERLRSRVEGKMSGASDGTSGQTARQELREKQKAEIDAENAKKTEEAVKREEADKSLPPTGTERNDEWSGTRDDAIKAMRQFNGNVDLYNRPVIDAYELTKKGWGNAPKKPGELTATVFSSQYGIKDANGKVREILVTPILQNGTVLSPRELKEYIRGLEGKDILEADDKSLVIGIDVPADGSSGQNLHKMQEAYGGHQPTMTETQLQTERNANPHSSETGNSRDGVTAQKTDATNAAGPSDPKFTTGGSAVMNTVSDEDYTSAQQRIADAKKSGKIPEQQDEETVWLHDNPRPVQPEMPDLEEFTESQPPKMKDIDDSYRTAYAIMLERIKAAGDDPASKAKRAKARRAQVLVAALGDLLQAAANMWGAAKGATSAKLSSISAGVAKRHAAEDAAELKREAQRAKDLEQMVRRGEKLTEAENKWIKELWEARENARKYNISERNKAILAEYGKRNEAWGKDYASWLRRLEKIGKDNASARREANTFARQKAMEDYRQRNREKNQATSHRNALDLKGAPSYSDLHKSSGKDDTPA